MAEGEIQKKEPTSAIPVDEIKVAISFGLNLKETTVHNIITQIHTEWDETNEKKEMSIEEFQEIIYKNMQK